MMPEVKAMLKICAYNMYGWRCEEDMLAGHDIEAAARWPAYPSSWPRTPDDPHPPDVMALTDRTARDARKRLQRIRDDLQNAGPFYPREQVRAALAHWNLEP
ncbi:hypothetical protein [Sphingomonas sp.]|uniref:hypothetical protein n=1 Tax=Sphingomonas sp. TaxID=28214 RepID=UPI003B00CA0C